MTDSNSDRRGFGDDQGTRVGEPTPGKPDEPGHQGEEQGEATNGEPRTGAGSEASRGIRGANEGGTGPGSQPLEHRDEEHQSHYGGGARSDFQGSE